MTLAVPNFRDLVDKTKANGMRDSLFHMMQFSRQAAINQSRTITVCQIKDLKKGECVLDKHWRYPYYIFFDTNGDLILNRSSNGKTPADTLLRQYPAMSLEGDLYSSQKYFTFSPPGTTRHNGSLTYCPLNDHSSASRIVVMRSGRVRYSKPSEIKC
jgi:Tfp pilus assembly protein FimT